MQAGMHELKFLEGRPARAYVNKAVPDVGAFERIDEIYQALTAFRVAERVFVSEKYVIVYETYFMQ